jgi:hypothetical protein
MARSSQARRRSLRAWRAALYGLVDGQGHGEGRSGRSLHDHEEEDCVEGQQKDEHDGGFDGEKDVEIHVCCLDRGGKLLAWRYVFMKKKLLSLIRVKSEHSMY